MSIIVDGFEMLMEFFGIILRGLGILLLIAIPFAAFVGVIILLLWLGDLGYGVWIAWSFLGLTLLYLAINLGRSGY
jgi:hypothetical protein